MQCFRFMDLPDRVIAFDELPEDLVKGFEMVPANGFPRHWKEWLGKKKRVTVIPAEKDPFTGQMRRSEPSIEEDYYFYLVDDSIGSDVDRWKDVCDYVKRNAPENFRLKEKIEDMAKPLAPNKTDSVMLEPEEVIVIPLAKAEEAKKAEEKAKNVVKCDECDSTFEGQWAANALRMHKNKKHKKAEVNA